MSKVTTMLVDTLRPNHGWRRVVRASEPGDRWKYWALRIGLAILGLLALYFFNILRHQGVG